MKSPEITRKKLKAGRKFILLGTVYTIENFLKDIDVVLVSNPLTGYRGRAPYKLVKRHGRMIEEAAAK